MIILYVKTRCPYSAVALKKIDDLGIEVEQRNIADEGILDEMLERGGKKQTPFLVDETTGIAMYESKAISIYLEEQYGSRSSDPEPTLVERVFHLHRVDDSDNCESCQ